MRCLRGLCKVQRGAALVEFAVSSLLFVVVLLAVVEFGLETHARNAVDRVAIRAAEAYASTRDLDVVAAVIADRTDVVLRRCLEPVRVVLFDAVSGVRPLRSLGRLADGSSADGSAVAFRLELGCRWPRLTPALGGLMGSPEGYTSTVFARLRVGGG